MRRISVNPTTSVCAEKKKKKKKKYKRSKANHLQYHLKHASGLCKNEKRKKGENENIDFKTGIIAKKQKRKNVNKKERKGR